MQDANHIRLQERIKILEAQLESQKKQLEQGSRAEEVVDTICELQAKLDVCEGYIEKLQSSASTDAASSLDFMKRALNKKTGMFVATLPIPESSASTDALEIIRGMARKRNYYGKNRYGELLKRIEEKTYEALLKSSASADSGGEGELVPMVSKLREGEGHTVTVCCDNPDDFNDLPNCCILVTADWTDWKEVDYRADTVSECLKLALADMEKSNG